MSVGTDFICKNEEAFVQDSVYSSTKFINCHLAYSFFSDEEGGERPLGKCPVPPELEFKILTYIW